MASFHLLVYFPFHYHTFLVNPEMLYADLIKAVFAHFNIDSRSDNTFLFQIFDIRYGNFFEFDDGYIKQLRKRLPRTSIEHLLARIVSRQQLYLLSCQSLFSKQISPDRLISTTFSPPPPPYLIVWLDEYFAVPTNFRLMKKYLFKATLLDGPICNSFCDDADIDNLILDDYGIDFDLPRFDGHLKIFNDVDECHHYITSRQNNLILLITSDRNGQKILPSISDRLLTTYILRNDWDDYGWGFKHLESLHMFDDEQSMLIRVIRDLARYFVDEASQLPPEEALNYLSWAKKLYIQADEGRCDKSFRCTSTIVNYIDHQLDHLEDIVRTSHKDYEDK